MLKSLHITGSPGSYKLSINLTYSISFLAHQYTNGRGFFFWIPHTDHTGPSNATRAILVFYDVMGFFPQTLQGADILAYSDREHPYQVFMPDFFEGTYAEVSWFPANTDEKMSKLKNFMSTAADPAKTVPRVPKVVKEIEEKVKKFDENGWGVMGYCWGGKVRMLKIPTGLVVASTCLCSVLNTPFCLPSFLSCNY